MITEPVLLPVMIFWLIVTPDVNVGSDESVCLDKLGYELRYRRRRHIVSSINHQFFGVFLKTTTYGRFGSATYQLLRCALRFPLRSSSC